MMVFHERVTPLTLNFGADLLLFEAFRLNTPHPISRHRNKKRFAGPEIAIVSVATFPILSIADCRLSEII